MTGRRRVSIHTRLFLGFAGVLLVSGALIVSAVYLGMRFLPDYDLSSVLVSPGAAVPGPAASGSPAPGSPAVPAVPLGPADPPPQESADGAGGSFAQTRVISTKEDVWDTVLTLSVAGAGLVAVVGLGAGWLLSRRLLAPLHTINKAAARAGEGDLTYRINAQGPRDELRQLADTFDETLARLERAFDAHQRFAANASHELLTPLANTHTALQVAMADRSGGDLLRVASHLLAANERSIETVHGLLELAGAEHAEPDTVPVDLADLTADACAELTARADAAGLTLESDLEQGHLLLGNAALLRTLVHNLLDNAIVHNVAHGWIHVAVFRNGSLSLEVASSGPPVDPEHVFEPFHRAGTRVRGETSGHGLGLAIAHAVARAHHGTVSATAGPAGGLTVRADFPADTR